MHNASKRALVEELDAKKASRVRLRFYRVCDRWEGLLSGGDAEPPIRCNRRQKMSDQQNPASEPVEIVTPQDVQAANNRNRGSATRPGWMAGVAFVAFVGGLAAFMFHF
jgi:hypothetical protein